MNETYKVYAFNVGARLRDTSYFFLFTDPGKEILVSYYFWGFQSPDDFILVDTGFTSQSMRKANADIF